MYLPTHSTANTAALFNIYLIKPNDKTIHFTARKKNFKKSASLYNQKRFFYVLCMKF